MDPSKACPRCGGIANRFRLSEPEARKNTELLHMLNELGKKSPVAMGVAGGIFAADRLGLVKVYLCRSCKHPFISL